MCAYINSNLNHNSYIILMDLYGDIYSDISSDSTEPTPGSSEYDQIRYIMHTQGFYDHQTLNVASKTCLFFSPSQSAISARNFACNSTYQAGQYLYEGVKSTYMAGGGGVVCGHQPVFNDNATLRWFLKVRSP